MNDNEAVSDASACDRPAFQSPEVRCDPAIEIVSLLHLTCVPSWRCFGYTMASLCTSVTTVALPLFRKGFRDRNSGLCVMRPLVGKNLVASLVVLVFFEKGQVPDPVNPPVIVDAELSFLALRMYVLDLISVFFRVSLS